jgi:hypothetical protein
MGYPSERVEPHLYLESLVISLEDSLRDLM